MEIKVVDAFTIDVFVDKQWTGWSRFKVSHSNGRISLKLIKGVPMSKEHFKSLHERLK